WALRTRLSVSALAAGTAAAAAPALGRAAARGGRAAGGRAAARSAARGASRVGSAAVGGAALCAVGGPAAVACAVLAGAGAWLATDLALLGLDERMNRQALERALAVALLDLREQLEAQLNAAYAELIASRYDAVQGEIERSFVPA